MSYILDALKRAEAERIAGVAAPAPLPSAYAAPPATRRLAHRFALPLGAALLAGLIGAAAFVLRADPTTEAPPAEVLPAVAEPQAPAASAEASIIPPPSGPSPIVRAPAPPVRAAAPARSPAPPAQTVSARPGTMRDLPEAIQREIPPLVIGGYLYAANPADRTVLINQRLRREGDEIAPGLVLESLQPDGMVLNYRGHRYRSTY
ncbi:MAG TPA: general secretion pathway protein GspB [Noviherbaspirillum sp.]|nr:general secretion pathway protein GspB [Noviherbaspirillum sp.]